MDSGQRREILEALGAYQKVGALSIEAKVLGKSMADESDRGMVVIVGSLTEDLLAKRIFENFVTMSDPQKKKILYPGGVLGSWSAKVTIASALGIIDGDDLEHLEVMMKMRNACAHSRSHIDFRTPVLKNAVALLFPQNFKEIVESKSQAGVRAFFTFGASYVWGRIKGESREISTARIQKMVDDLNEDLRKKLDTSRKKRTAQSKKGNHPGPKGKRR